MERSPGALIEARSLSYVYPHEKRHVLDDLDLRVEPGEYLAILGSNGSGKSTLLKLLVGLLVPTSGTIRVAGDSGAALDPSTAEGALAVRRILGSVLQNPDDQIVGTIAEEDTAFGPENLGLPKVEVARRVEESLSVVGLSAAARRPPHFLSGGEKQRLAIAGALALGTNALLLDEACSMIDPAGREGLLDLLDSLVAAGHTIIHVTHSPEEAWRAKRAVVLSRGKLVYDGTPRALYSRGDFVAWGLASPESVAAAAELSRFLPGFSATESGARPFADGLSVVLRASAQGRSGTPTAAAAKAPALAATVSSTTARAATDPALVFSSVSHEYLGGTAFTSRGIDRVSFTLPCGASLALVGETGSGKSTILRHANAVLLPDAGSLRVLGLDPCDPAVELAKLRLRAVLSVQQPEAALFERYCADDVAYGPRNAGLSGASLVAAVTTAMDSVGLPYTEFRDRDTRGLSGGEKRKLALAGVLAMEGDLLLLDEPTAGLDGAGRAHILDLLLSLGSRGVTVVATTHSMEEACRFNLVGIVKGGRLVAYGPPREVFGRVWEDGWGVPLPWAAEVGRRLSDSGARLPFVPLTVAELPKSLALDGSAGDLKAQTGETATASASAATANLCGSEVSVPAGGSAGRERPHRRRRRGAGLEFFRNATLGQFLDRPSPLRSLGAGAKLLGLLAVATVALVWPSPAAPFAVLAFALSCGLALGSVGPRHLLRGLVPAVPYLALVVLIQLLYTWPGESGKVYFALGPISVTETEVLRSLLLVVRLIALMALLALYSATTRLSDTLRAFTAFFAPFERLGLPGKELATIAGIALRFVPVLVDEAERIAVAQLSRGGGYAGKGRLRAALAMTVPIFLRALERAESLAVAMELRLYTGSHPVARKRRP